MGNMPRFINCSSAMKMRTSLSKALPDIWYSDSRLALLLLPLAWLYGLATALRRFAYTHDLLRRPGLPVPVVIVGNISVGGTGKTPLVAWLSQRLREAGYIPGIVSRGYGSAGGADGPQLVGAGDDPHRYGDEAVLLAELTGCPVCVGSDRVAAVRHIARQGVTVVISDDGLQHYRMRRNFELVVIDGQRGLGNGHLLPAGPLRESAQRLQTVDAVVLNGGEHDPAALNFVLQPEDAVNLANGSTRPLAGFASQRVWAVAGIGNPDRFNTQLEKAGIQVDPVFVPDHGQHWPHC
jgi:tetraacyldisaccharide 4'-kinase